MIVSFFGLFLDFLESVIDGAFAYVPVEVSLHLVEKSHALLISLFIVFVDVQDVGVNDVNDCLAVVIVLLSAVTLILGQDFLLVTVVHQVQNNTNRSKSQPLFINFIFARHSKKGPFLNFDLTYFVLHDWEDEV